MKDIPNHFYSINFRTTPMNSTGVAHILEHTTLCGSQKYPVRYVCNTVGENIIATIKMREKNFTL